MSEYANPDVLVSCDWVESHRADPAVRLVEVDVDTSAYDEGHIPEAVAWNWQSQLQDPLRRDIAPREEFEKLLGQSGIGNDTTIVVYGDNNNWFACWAFWQLKYYGHADVRVMNGGRKKWLADGRPGATEVPTHEAKTYKAADPDQSIRAYRDMVFETMDKGNRHLVDVRSPAEFTGEILAPPGLNETCQRGGHIPGAQNIPWATAVNEDGTFKSRDELAGIYGDKGVENDKETIAYCRIGERSSHTWYVLKYLLGYDKVRNYDGSWTEWGNLVDAPIAR